MDLGMYRGDLDAGWSSREGVGTRFQPLLPKRITCCLGSSAASLSETWARAAMAARHGRLFSAPQLQMALQTGGDVRIKKVPGLCSLCRVVDVLPLAELDAATKA